MQACSSLFWRNDIVTKRINFDKNVSLFCQNSRTLQFIFFQFHNVKKEMNKFFEFYLLSRSDILRRPQKFEKKLPIFLTLLSSFKDSGRFLRNFVVFQKYLNFIEVTRLLEKRTSVWNTFFLSVCFLSVNEILLQLTKKIFKWTLSSLTKISFFFPYFDL